MIALGIGLWIAPCHALAQEQSSNHEGSKTSHSKEVGSEKRENPVVEPDAYIIGADDVLQISVWKEPDVTRTVPVRPDGKITLPLINDVQAAGLTPVQLSLSITEKLKKFIANPLVSVSVASINSRKIYIMGEIGRSGAYPLLANMTVLQALASAGSFTQFANLKKIYVMRVENGKQVKYPFNYKEVIKGNLLEQNIVLKPGDTIVVP
jgi:polysaccharide export outer membrane protein